MAMSNFDNKGIRLREERLRLGLSQAKFAELMGKKSLAVLRYEKGERSLSLDDLDMLHRAGVDIWFLITGQRTGVVPLPESEQEILKLFHQVEPSQRGTLLTLVRNFAQSFSVG